MTQLTIIGSTGSVGRNTLKVVEHLAGRFTVFALSAYSSMELLAEQVAAFHPKVVALADATRIDEFRRHCVYRHTEVPISSSERTDCARLHPHLKSIPWSRRQWGLQGSFPHTQPFLQAKTLPWQIRKRWFWLENS